MKQKILLTNLTKIRDNTANAGGSGTSTKFYSKNHDFLPVKTDLDKLETFLKEREENEQAVVSRGFTYLLISFIS